MPEIRVLSDEVIGKISAGEVVERPAGALKELLENSVDAGAKTIRVDVEKAGRRLIRVSDDGKGMSQEDLLLAACHHSTSKILGFEDISKLATFGFRGEALYSIAAVSKMTIASAQSGAPEGFQILIEAGKISRKSPAPPVPGTTVEVRDIFFNTPARAKFLKSEPAERSRLIRVVEECALANLSVSFFLRTDGAEIFSLPADSRPLKEAALSRAFPVLGKEAAGGLVYAEEPSIGLKAFISEPARLLATRALQFFFVNRRPVSCRTLQQALYKAYEGARPKDRHPACVMYLELPPDSFDVNIHPQKLDVRFADEGAIFRAVSRAVSERIVASKRPAEIIPSVPAQPTVDLPIFAELVKPQPFSESPAGLPEAMSVREPADYAQATVPPAPEEKEPSWWKPPYRFAGQISDSFLIYESAEGMVILDQHAAQERIKFEEYLRQLSAQMPVIQKLLLPVAVELSASGAENVMRWKDWLSSAGFEVERYGPREVAVRSIPSIFGFSDDKLCAFITQLSETLGEPERCAESVRRETVALLACKNSVKAGDPLEPEEAMRLIYDLKSCKDALSCPHGRPVMISMTLDELARRFHRPKA